MRDLRLINGEDKDIIRYTRFDKDPQGFQSNSPFRGHMVGITASKEKDVYEWLLALKCQ